MRCVLVHGFTQTAASWDGVFDEAGGDGDGDVSDIVALDVVPGGDLWSTAKRIGETAGRAAYVGYSMGGRLCLHLALADPGRVERLVLLGATAGIEDDGERAARRLADERLADDIERDGVEAFLERWLSHPMFAGLAERGPRQWDGAVLAACLRFLGTGSQEPLWDRLAELAMPVLVVAGERDEKFIRIGRRMADAIGDNASFAVVPDAGHAAHLEQPDAFRRVVAPFLA